MRSKMLQRFILSLVAVVLFAVNATAGNYVLKPDKEITLLPINFLGPNQLDSLGRKTGLWVYTTSALDHINDISIDTYSNDKLDGIALLFYRSYNSPSFSLQWAETFETISEETSKTSSSLYNCSPIPSFIITKIEKNKDFIEDAEIIGLIPVDSTIQVYSNCYHLNDSIPIYNGWSVCYEDRMITDPYDVGSWNFYDRQGNKTVKRYEPKKSVYGHGDYDDGYPIKYNYIGDAPVILNQCPIEFNAPNLVDRDGMKIGPWAEWECDNYLSINLYDDGKKIGYQHTYRFLNDSTAYLAILTEMKDDHVSGNSLVFHPETRMPYIVAKNTSPNKDFKDEADLLIGFGDADKTVQSYIYIYEENRLVSEGWMICLEDDFMKRRCYFVGDMKVYDKNGRATTLRAPMDGTKIPQFNLPVRMDVGFAE